MKKLLFATLFLLCTAAIVSAVNMGKETSPYFFKGNMPRQVLENYLSRAVTLAEFLSVDPYCIDGVYPFKERDVEFIKETGAKFIGRAIYRWGREEVLNDPAFWANARRLIKEVHRNDPEVIFQGAVFETVDGQVNTIQIPQWVFKSLDMPVENRNFSYEAMLNPDGKFVNHWKKGASVPDITQVETQLWFLFLIGSYVDAGIEAIHLGQVSLIGMNDPQFRTWAGFLKKVRQVINPKARREFVLFDAHTPHGGMVVDGVSLLDFNSFPLRIKEITGKPMEGILEKGYLDSMYGRSKGCLTPSGWECDALPYLVEFDNFGISKHPGVANTEDHYIWGYDEITWLYLKNKAEKEQWIRYASDWIGKNDKNAFLQMPGARVVSTGKGGPAITCRATAPTQDLPQGMDLTGVIKQIWEKKD